MVKPIKMHESGTQPNPEKTGWSTLATITTFDRGKTSRQQWRKAGTVVPKRVFTPSSLFVESLIDQLCKLFEKDPLSQKKLYGMICQKLYEMKLIDKTYNMEEFQFMRSYYQQALFHLLTISSSPAIDCQLEKIINQSPSNLSLPPPLNSGLFDWSRYQNEFEEIEFIARGGFGRVFRVKNKVDGCEYAIKKICVRYFGDEQLLQSLREVRTLAKLDHCNIVAYKAAWLEPLSGLVCGEDCSTGSSSRITPDIEHTSDEVPESSISEKESRDEVEDDSGNIIFANGTEDASEEVLGAAKSSSNPFKEVSHLLLECNTKRQGNSVNHTAGKVKMLNLPEHYGNLCDHSSGSSNKGCRGRKIPGMRNEIMAVLHIQMQLCKESLRKWLDLRNEALQQHLESHMEKGSLLFHLDEGCVLTALRIFQEILNGVVYMHSEGIVHHDLKPSNIFVEGFEYFPPCDVEGEAERSGDAASQPKVVFRQGSVRSQVRVGDFGLACRIAQPPTTLDEEVPSDDEGGAATMAVIPADSTGLAASCLIQTGVSTKNGDEKAKEGVGTRLYAAPEQLDGHCNLMSDTYSLAIILFELLHPFFTAMERGKVISALRSSGNVPDEFERRYPQMSSLIKDMLSQKPSDRPQLEKIIQYLPLSLLDHKSNAMKIRNDSISSDDDISVREYIIRSRSRNNSFTQIHEHRESYANLSQSWEEVLYEENQMESSYCSNFTCHVVREQQDETISKLREENLKKDELIEELKGRILQLEIARKNLVEG